MKNIGKAILFIALCILLFFGLKCIYVNKNYGNWNIEKLYELPDNSVDVLAVGDSHILTTTNPAILWRENGIAAYTLSSEGQDIWISYHRLVEALKTQSPKVMILDIHNITTTTEFSRPGVAPMAIPGMKFSINKWEVIKATMPKKEWLAYVFEWPIFHSRYKNLEKKNFMENYGDVFIENNKGCGYLFFSNMPENIPDISWVTETAQLPEKTEMYLHKIIELSKEKNIPLLLIAAPYWGINEEEQKMYNRVEEIARENQVEYANFNVFYEEIGLIPEEDYADPHHLSYMGAEKFSSYLGKYLIKHYELPNHQGTAKYSSWDDNQHDYEKLVEDHHLERAETMKEVFAFLNNPDYTTVISTRNTFEEECVGTLLATLGIDDSNYHNNGIWMIENQQIIAKIPWGSSNIIQRKLGKDDLVMSLSWGQDPFVMYAGKDYMHIKDGVNIFVYSQPRKCVVTSMGFDAADSYKMKK